MYVFLYVFLYVFIFWNDEICGLKTTEGNQWIPKRVKGHQEVSRDDSEDSEDDDEDSEDDDEDSELLYKDVKETQEMLRDVT